jgi:hypothetical protein
MPSQLTASSLDNSAAVVVSSSSNGNKQCYHCNGYGHISATCPDRAAGGVTSAKAASMAFKTASLAAVAAAATSVAANEQKSNGHHSVTAHGSRAGDHVRCYNCHGRGHFSTECPSRFGVSRSHDHDHTNQSSLPTSGGTQTIVTSSTSSLSSSEASSTSMIPSAAVIAAHVESGGMITTRVGRNPSHTISAASTLPGPDIATVAASHGRTAISTVMVTVTKKKRKSNTDTNTNGHTATTRTIEKVKKKKHRSNGKDVTIIPSLSSNENTTTTITGVPIVIGDASSSRHSSLTSLVSYGDDDDDDTTPASVTSALPNTNSTSSLPSNSTGVNVQ